MGNTVQSVKNVTWANQEHTAINCAVKFVDRSDELPFTAAGYDPEPLGRDLFAALVAGEYGPIAAYIAPPPVVPVVVSAAQGGIALINAGLMNAVQAVVDAADTPAGVKWAWSHAQAWDRSSQTLAYLAEKAGITSQQMDDIFVAAAKIAA